MGPVSPLIAILTFAYFAAGAVLVLKIISPPSGDRAGSFLQLVAELGSFFVSVFLLAKAGGGYTRAYTGERRNAGKMSGATVILCTVLFAVFGILLLDVYVRYLPELLSGLWPFETAAMYSVHAYLAVAAFAGLFSGLITSVSEVVAYMLEVRRVLLTMKDNIWNHSPSEFFCVFAPLALFVVLGGAVLAISLESAWQLMALVAPRFDAMNSVFGGVAGGAFAGLILGPVGAWYFGRKHLPIANPCASVIGATPGLIGIVLLMAWGRGFAPSMAQIAAIISVVMCMVITLFGATVGQLLKVDQKIMATFEDGSERALLIGGVSFGVFCGATFGLAISVSFLVINLAVA